MQTGVSWPLFPQPFAAMPTQTHYRACNLCEAICGLEIEHENGRVLHIRGDAATRSVGGTSAPKPWVCRMCTRTPTACAGRCGARLPGAGRK
ncbi:hypothetical protein [Hymenobacter amundsenii]|uniref:hypothetical protein n=1 Tax=Hymenobacter amundsenii TaxID=2006685 RepID=UPI0037443604